MHSSPVLIRSILGGGGALLALLLTGCGLQSSTNPAALPTTSPAIPTVAPGAAGPNASASAAAGAAVVQTFTNQNWGLAVSNPSRYKGSTVTLTGQVFNVEQDASRVGIQIWTDPLRGQGNTIVVFPKQGSPDVHKDDQVEVQGTLDGTFSGKSDDGETLTLPRVQAASVKVVQHASPAPAAAASASAAAKPSASTPAATSAPAAGLASASAAPPPRPP